MKTQRVLPFQIHALTLHLGFVSVLLIATSAPAETVHLATPCDDANPGTAEKPVATLAKALALVLPASEPSEVIVSGKDQHTIFKDPKYADTAAYDFHVRPGSPDIGAGENGSTIGALGAKEPAAKTT